MIREARYDDLEQILILGWDMHQESRYKDLDYDVEKSAMFFQMAMDDSKYLFLVSEKAGQIIGGFIGYCVSQWFSDDKTAGDLVLYVQPEHRGGLSAVRLVKKYIEWAKDQGVKDGHIGLGITTGIHTEKTGRFYESLGFEKTGIVMSHRGAK
jgi:GNAT superfamily N-acetyltransferase